MSKKKKSGLSDPSFSQLPNITFDERNDCLELGNMLLGLNYAVIHRYRTLPTVEERIKFKKDFEDALEKLCMALKLLCPCGICANGRCCVCP